MKALRWDITVWWKPLLIWCRLAFWEETVFLALFPYWLLTAFWYLLFSLFSPTGPTLDNSSSIWRPSEVKIAHFDVSWQYPAFCCICVWKHGPCLEELPSALVGIGWGRRVSLALFPPVSLLSSLSFLSFWSHHQIFLSFYEWRLPESILGNGWLKKTFEKMRLSKLSPLIKAIVPVGEKEESRRARALLVMKNAMQEGASLWSRPVKPTMYSTTDTALVHQAFLCCCTTMSVWPRGLIWNWGTTPCLYYTSAGHQIIS